MLLSRAANILTCIDLYQIRCVYPATIVRFSARLLDLLWHSIENARTETFYVDFINPGESPAYNAITLNYAVYWSTCHNLAIH